VEFSKQELAERWGVSPRTVYSLRDKFGWAKVENDHEDSSFTDPTYYVVPKHHLESLDKQYLPASLFEDALHAFEVYSHYMREDAPRSLIQTFSFPHKPTGIVIAGDIHIGSHGVDYRLVREKTEIIQDCQDMYCIQIGDIMNNMLMGNLATVGALHDESIMHQYKISQAYLARLKSSLLFGISGNHEAWTSRLTGLDPQQTLYANIDVPYHQYEGCVTLQVGDVPYRMQARHQFSGKSKYHPWQPHFNLLQHGDHSAWNDQSPHIIALGHTHDFGIAECRENGELRLFITIGSPKTQDGYARRLGFCDSHPIMPCIVLDPDERGWIVFNDLRKAADYLNSQA
jgi:hypothetical protein